MDVTTIIVVGLLASITFSLLYMTRKGSFTIVVKQQMEIPPVTITQSERPQPTIDYELVRKAYEDALKKKEEDGKIKTQEYKDLNGAIQAQLDDMLKGDDDESKGIQ